MNQLQSGRGSGDRVPDVSHPCIVDTNVILVANGQHPGVTQACVAACQDWLSRIMASGCIVLDDAHEILGEYGHKCDPQAGQGVGDAFVRWARHHLDDPTRVAWVHLERDPVWGFRAFPREESLWLFDASDRKFVAAACSHPSRPPILQAADSKWLDWAPTLAGHGVEVTFLCDADVHRFHAHKFGH